MEPAAEHIRLLEEGDLLYRILESEIRNTRTPLPILFGELSDRTIPAGIIFFRAFYHINKKYRGKLFDNL